MEDYNLQKLFLEKAEKNGKLREYNLVGVGEKSFFLIENGEELEMEMLETDSLKNVEEIIRAFRTVFFVFLEEKEGRCLYPYRFPCYRDFFLIHLLEKTSIGMIYQKIEGMEVGEWSDGVSPEECMKVLIKIGYSVLISLYILHKHGIYHRNISAHAIIYNDDRKRKWNERVCLKNFEGSCNARLESCDGKRDDIWKDDVILLGKTLSTILTKKQIEEKVFFVLENPPPAFRKIEDVFGYYEFHYSHIIPGELMDEYLKQKNEVIF